MYMKKDISILIDDIKLNVRVSAFITCGDYVLLQSDPEAGFYYLPGGRVKLNESSVDAIKREIFEELDFNVENPKLFYYVENFFNHNQTNFHELLYIFSVELSQDEFDKLNNFKVKDKQTSKVYWVHKDEYKQLDCKPTLVKNLFEVDKKTLHHIIHND